MTYDYSSPLTEIFSFNTCRFCNSQDAGFANHGIVGIVKNALLRYPLGD